MGEWKEDGYSNMFASPATVFFSVGSVYMFAVAHLHVIPVTLLLMSCIILSSIPRTLNLLHLKHWLCYSFLCKSVHFRTPCIAVRPLHGGLVNQTGNVQARAHARSRNIRSTGSLVPSRSTCGVWGLGTRLVD